MSHPIDVRFTKLKLIFHQEEKILLQLEEEASQAAFETRKDREKHWVEFVKNCKAIGYCPNCERHISDCKGHLMKG